MWQSIRGFFYNRVVIGAAVGDVCKDGVVSRRRRVERAQHLFPLDFWQLLNASKLVGKAADSFLKSQQTQINQHALASKAAQTIELGSE